jgi:opacity protein-like surface antigen
MRKMKKFLAAMMILAAVMAMASAAAADDEVTVVLINQTGREITSLSSDDSVFWSGSLDDGARMRVNVPCWGDEQWISFGDSSGNFWAEIATARKGTTITLKADGKYSCE